MTHFFHGVLRHVHGASHSGFTPSLYDETGKVGGLWERFIYDLELAERREAQLLHTASLSRAETVVGGKSVMPSRLAA